MTDLDHVTTELDRARTLADPYVVQLLEGNPRPPAWALIAIIGAFVGLPAAAAIAVLLLK